jgi:oxygen-independent coproporphyrinogen-3 oxidase
VIEHLYVHVPFCARKCPYCDFNSHAGREDEADGYVEALLLEARARSEGVRPRTVFVGGGTPTHLEPRALERLLAGLRDAIDLSAVEEWTVESNPGTLDASKAALLVRHGVDRASVGVQSFHDARLKVLGRVHGADEAARAVETMRAAGIPRLSLDLMLATPGQAIEEQRRDLERAIALRPEHVSTYVLTFEEGTAYATALAAGRLPAPQEERDLAHLAAACEQLGEAGYARYEVSNHAKPGAESRHNLAYWRNAEWLGLGAGAHSHAQGTRWKNVDDPAEYAAAVRARGHATAWTESPTSRQRAFESLMMGLRLVREGVDLERVARASGVDPRVEHADAIARHVRAGRLELVGSRLRATASGLDVLNRVLLDFVPDEERAPELATA